MLKIIQSFEILSCLIFFIIVIMETNFCEANNDELEDIKPRRGGTIGLFAQPRVGRSKWDIIPNSYEEYDDIPKMVLKRQGLVPFPRVGRNENQYARQIDEETMEKRTGASANSGLWFGPRLGRIQKRNSHIHDTTNNGLL